MFKRVWDLVDSGGWDPRAGGMGRLKVPILSPPAGPECRLRAEKESGQRVLRIAWCLAGG